MSTLNNDKNNDSSLKEDNEKGFITIVVVLVIFLLIIVFFFLSPSIFKTADSKVDETTILDTIVNDSSTSISHYSDSIVDYLSSSNEADKDSTFNNDDSLLYSSTYASEDAEENIEDDTEPEPITNSVVVKMKGAFNISSSNPDGFYVMVGTFSDYTNAVKLQNMNPTDFTCHIFEPNENNLSRVGLFISKTDLDKTKMVLKKVLMMQKDSWILYNSQI